MLNNENIAAGIVTFNPKLNMLRSNIEAVFPQVSLVIVVDNGSDNIDEIVNLCEEFRGMTVIQNGSNLGIAKALNEMFCYANDHCYDWILTLDQDSCVHDDFVSICKPYMIKESVASISTLREDRRCKQDFEYDHQSQYELVKMCITSGNLVKISAWAEIGGFNEPLFIDMVDAEFCYRLRQFGYKIIRVNQRLLIHELGRSVNRQFFGKRVIVRNHDADRKYYIYRNTIYVLRFIPISHEDHLYWSMISTLVKTILYEDHKMLKVVASMRGVFDGLCMQETDFNSFAAEKN